MKESVEYPLRGKRYSVRVPDTLDLADRARLAINGMGGSINPRLMTMYGQVHFCTPTPHFSHWASADTLLDPKFGESFPMMRLMSGSDQYLELESRYRAAMRSRIQDGLYWDLASKERPWRNWYATPFYGEGKYEDFATLPGTGRMLRALLVWRKLGDDTSETEEAIRSIVRGLARIAISKNDYCFYPEKGGWGEPCSYPRSGWLNTDEARDETEGGEGSIVAMHGHQIYGAARWYAESGDGVAFDLAARLSRYCLLPRFWGGVPDPEGNREGIPGHIAPRKADPAFTAGWELGHWYSHFHARAIALRGLLEFANIAGDTKTAEFVRRGYEYTLTQGIPRMGWINCYPGASNSMEGCALGDLIGLAIRLSDLGLGDYWDDADAIVRNHLIEQQIVDTEPYERLSRVFTEKCGCEVHASIGMLDYENVLERCRGIFAGMSYPTIIKNPFSMHCCTGNATQGIYLAWEGALRENGLRAEVNLLINRAGTLVDVDSSLPYEGKVIIKNKSARTIAVRIPSWVDEQQLRIDSGGSEIGSNRIGRYLVLDGVPAGAGVTLTFPIRETEGTYTVNANSPSEIVYTCTFRGSTLVDISPRDTDPHGCPLYDRSSMRKDSVETRLAERFVAEGRVI